jgi:hypothetical protein
VCEAKPPPPSAERLSPQVPCAENTSSSSKSKALTEKVWGFEDEAFSSIC